MGHPESWISLNHPPKFSLGFPDSSVGKESPVMQETPVQFLGWEDLLEKGEATHSNIPDFPCGSAGRESACNAGDLGSIPRLGRTSGEGNSYSLQYSGLENSMDCVVCGVAKSQT